MQKEAKPADKTDAELKWALRVLEKTGERPVGGTNSVLRSMEQVRVYNINLAKHIDSARKGADAAVDWVVLHGAIPNRAENVKSDADR